MTPASVVAIIDHQLRHAIASRRLIQFTYASVSRVAEPHDYGELNDTAKLLVYQLRSSPPARGWRLLEVAKIQHLVVLERTFAGSRIQAGQQHHHWDTVFARVE
jgi:hypothetical protein